MATPIIYTWTPNVKDDVCLSQAVVFATTPNLVLNGNLSTGSPYSSISFGNVSRVVSITSTVNLTGVNFTITGTYNGLPQIEAHAGPGAGLTVETLKYFNTITSVTASANAANVKLGTGTTGQTNWFCHDSYVQVPSLAVSVVKTAGTFTYSFEPTTSDAINNYVQTASTLGIVIPNPDNANAYTRIMNAAQAGINGWYQYPARYSRISVTASADSAFKAFFMQQGLTN